MKRRELRCAIYTRKSSEEGLEQSFNSLDAQREASQAFIVSQRHEGWHALGTRYDDGGYSGGTMQRPALERLLEDVRNRKIDVIVVYKVDRLTRSLADFAKIVEILDANQVSFVSVTQQFNTTTSMGRLTLNVLLSFAQFEREVTGERIRDKIAASKKKGMWMGGLVPLGYDLRGRKLVPKQKEEALVRRIFELYLELGCVSKLTGRLVQEKIKSKVYITGTGSRLGGAPFSRGALYHLLRNHLYIGEIRHQDKWYPGEHAGIVPVHVWNSVQKRLTGNLRQHRHNLQQRSSSLLAGVLEDAKGNRYTPSFTNKNGRRYRYYVSQSIIQNPGNHHSTIERVPASEIEGLVCGRVRTLLASQGDLFDTFRGTENAAMMKQFMVSAREIERKFGQLPLSELRRMLLSFIRKVVVKEENVQIFLSKSDLRAALQNPEEMPKAVPPLRVSRPDDLLALSVAAKRKRCGGAVHLVLAPNTMPANIEVKNSLVKAVARAHSWYAHVLNGQIADQRALARKTGLTERYVGRVFPCAFLAPDIIETIVEGRQPRELTFEKLTRDIPLSWAEQRTKFGFTRSSGSSALP